MAARPSLPRRVASALGRSLSAALLLGALSLAPRVAVAQDLGFGFVPSPAAGEKPALLITPERAVKELHVEITAGGKSWTFDKVNQAAGKQIRLSWDRDTSVTEAEAFVRAVFPDGFVGEYNVPIRYSYGERLSVDLSRATADVSKRTLKVKVTAKVDTADITAYGAKKVVVDQSSVSVGSGPGEITLPWVGDPADVVLLDVTLHGGSAYTGFTYSPWFLNIPHDDVLFDSDSANVPPTESFKLEATLRDLTDVLDKYGDIVPVKLYIAGCTDTVGDGAHNKDLSTRRAKAIAVWLRAHGYDKPIFYHGYGEGFLAVPTGDGVDEARNRRVLYMVGANPPPPGSGVPSGSWIAL